MGRLIVVEGLDGSGKQTITRELERQAAAAGVSVGRIAFPRYGRSVHADLVADGLYGRLGDLGDSVYGMALLFALDRAGAADEIRAALDRHDIVLLDRYISSNAAYGSARLGGPEQPTDFPEWVKALEVDRFGIPVPDLQVLLDTPVHVARDRAARRAAGDDSRALDSFESDDALQDRTARMYHRMAAQEYLSPWRILAPGEDLSLSELLGSSQPRS